MSKNILTERQLEILQHIRDKAVGNKRQLLEHVLDNSHAKNDIEAVCKIINDEFLMHGILDEKYNPNEYGRELEGLLDIVNKPRLG